MLVWAPAQVSSCFLVWVGFWFFGGLFSLGGGAVVWGSCVLFWGLVVFFLVVQHKLQEAKENA